MLIASGWRTRSMLWGLVPIGVAALSTAVAVETQDLHWRWSRDDFEAAANGRLPACEEPAGCELGWWDVMSIEEAGSIRIVWVEHEWCYAGFGYVRGPDPGAPGAAGGFVSEVAELVASRGFGTVTPWRDDWYTVCVRT